MLGAIVLLLVWALLLFGAHAQSGAIHLLYAAGMILLARRLILGAPRFVS